MITFGFKVLWIYFYWSEILNPQLMVAENFIFAQYLYLPLNNGCFFPRQNKAKMVLFGWAFFFCNSGLYETSSSHCSCVSEISPCQLLVTGRSSSPPTHLQSGFANGPLFVPGKMNSVSKNLLIRLNAILDWNKSKDTHTNRSPGRSEGKTTVPWGVEMCSSRLAAWGRKSLQENMLNLLSRLYDQPLPL